MNGIWSFDYLDPLGSPLGRFERTSKVNRFTCNLTISELHNIYCIKRTASIIRNNIFTYPETSLSTHPQNLKTNFSRVMFPEFCYIVFTRELFTGLRKFNYNVVMINHM